MVAPLCLLSLLIARPTRRMASVLLGANAVGHCWRLVPRILLGNNRSQQLVVTKLQHN